MPWRTSAVVDIAAATIAAGYRLLGMCLRPAVPFILSGRVARGKEDPQRLGERYGRPSLPRPPGRLVWVHAASVGETNAILPLINRLTGIGLAVVFTTTTLTSAAIAAQKLPRGAVHQFAPLDLAPFVAGFLAFWRPNLAVFVESEMWPTMVRKLAEADVPLIVANARLSKKSYRGWQRFAGFAGTVFPKIALCLAQSDGDAARFAGLGAVNVRSVGNLKFDVPPLTADSGAVTRLTAAIDGRPSWVAASTHEGEEAIVAEAHRLIRQRHPQVLTVIVPRHPERGDAVRAMLAARGLTVAQRSRGNPLLHEIDVYLADTLGELGLFYRLAPIAFLGGSLIPHGGQNPIEPTHLAAAVLHGPHVHNFADIYAALDAAVPAAPIADAASLADAVAALIDDPAGVVNRAAAAREALARFSGALDATMTAILPYLAGKPGAEVP
jgi:3-deoxy-D-manno-octulosonic-acid transferase